MNLSLSKPILGMLSWDLFNQISTGRVSLLQYNAFTNLLMQNNISFDTSFSSGTNKLAPGAQITVNLTPTTQLVINLQFSEGATEFTAN